MGVYEGKSEVARLRREIEDAYIAAQRALTGFAITAPHEFITARMENIALSHEALQQLVGPEEAIRLVAETLNAAGEAGDA